ncbi:MAG: hypothetical protein IAF02_05840 [Anaerolineae bacterium]|nr:hypothetical protein [Anaerolineae bacterium]
MEQISTQLAAQLYRIDCPASEDLGEYHLKMLSGEQAQGIRQHVSICPHCSWELAQLEAYLTDLAPEITFSNREKIHILVAKLIPRGLDASFSPAPFPAFALRGEADSEPLMYEVDDYQLNLEIQDDPMKPGHKSILGLLVGGGGSVFEAQLRQNGRSLQQTTIDDIGNFVFTGVQPGTYDLILSQHVTEIHVQAFQI